MDYKQTEALKVEVPNFQQLHGRLLDLAWFFVLGKVRAEGYRFFVAPAEKSFRTISSLVVIGYHSIK